MKRRKESNELFVSVDDLKDFDLMRNPEIRNAVLETVEEWKSVRDSLCPDSGLKCDTCRDYNKCDKRVYDKIQSNRNI